MHQGKSRTIRIPTSTPLNMNRMRESIICELLESSFFFVEFNDDASLPKSPNKLKQVFLSTSTKIRHFEHIPPSSLGPSLARTPKMNQRCLEIASLAPHEASPTPEVPPKINKFGLQAPKMVPKMVRKMSPRTSWMAPPIPKMALPQIDNPTWRGRR